MKIVFLDFDGVLNSAGSLLYEKRRRYNNKQIKFDSIIEHLCHVCTSNFQEILNRYSEVKIVLSTSWREFFTMDKIKDKLESYGIDSSRVIDKTPSLYMESRGEEIKQWLDKHPEVTHYVIIDDNDDKITQIHGEKRFVLTSYNSGLTLDKANEVMEKLSSKNMKSLKEE